MTSLGYHGQLDPGTEYDVSELLETHSTQEISDYIRAREQYLAAREEKREGKRAARPAPPPIPPKPMVGNLQTAVVMQPVQSPESSMSEKRIRLAPPAARAQLGDKSSLVAGYREISLCHAIHKTALERAEIAAQMLDEDHRNQINAMIMKAGMKRGNASHADLREMSTKRAMAIASQAEMWVYQAQAAAAKHAAKQAKLCKHQLSGRRKLTREEKERRYTRGKNAERYKGQPRGSRAERALRKYQKKMEKIAE